MRFTDGNASELFGQFRALVEHFVARFHPDQFRLGIEVNQGRSHWQFTAAPDPLDITSDFFIVVRYHESSSKARLEITLHRAFFYFFDPNECNTDSAHRIQSWSAMTREEV